MPLIESSGRWHLRSTRNSQWTASDSTAEDMQAAIPLKYNGNVINLDTFPGWNPKAIENIYGDNRALWTNDNGRINYWTLDDNWNQLESQRLQPHDSFGNLIAYVSYDEDLDLGYIIYKPQDGFFTILRSLRLSPDNSNAWSLQAVENINDINLALLIKNDYERVDYEVFDESGTIGVPIQLDVVDKTGNISIFKKQDNHYVLLNQETSQLAHLKSQRTEEDIAPISREGFGLLAAERINGTNHAIMRNLDEAVSFSHLTFDDEGLITSQQNLSGSHAIETYGNTYAFKSRNCYVLYSPDENDLRVVTNDGNYLPSRGPERMDLLAAETLNGKTYILIGNSISGLKQCELSPTGEILREHDLQPIEVSGDTLTYKRRDTVVTLDTTSGEFLYLKNLGSDVPPSDYLYLEKVVSTDKFATKSGKISGRINNYLGRTGSIERLALWEAKSGRHHLWRMDDNWDNVERVSMSDIDTEDYLRVFKENDYIWISERGTGDFGVLTNENNKPISAQKYRDIGYISMASERVNGLNQFIFWHKNDWTLIWSLDDDFNRSSALGINMKHGDINTDEVTFQIDLNQDRIIPKEVIENSGNASVFKHSSGRTLISSENLTNSDLTSLIWSASAAEAGFYPGKEVSKPGIGSLKPGKEIKKPGSNSLKPGKESAPIPYVMPHRVWNAKAAEEIDGRKYVAFESGRSERYQIRIYETVPSLIRGDFWAIGSPYESVNNLTLRYQELEKQFGADFNDDGFSDDYVEESGEVSLGINDFKEYVVIDGGKVYETGLFDHTAGREVLQGEGHSRLARGTEIYGAETVDGFNFLITGNRARTRFMLNTVDNHWKKVDNGKKNLPLNTIAFGRMEAAFQQDLDRDQITGLEYNVIEEVGQSALLEKDDMYFVATQSFEGFSGNTVDPQFLSIQPLMWDGRQLTRRRIYSELEYGITLDIRGIEMGWRDVDINNSIRNQGPYIKKSLAMTIDWADRPGELRVYFEGIPNDNRSTPPSGSNSFQDGTRAYQLQEMNFEQDFNNSGTVYHT